MKTMWKKCNWLKGWKNFWFGPEFSYERTVTLAEENFWLREIKTQDVPQLLQLEKKVYAGSLPWTKSAFLLELNSLSLHRYLLLENKTQIIGFIGLRIHGKDCHITNIAVDPNFQNKGIGTFFLEEGKLFALENDCTRLSLEVRVSNRDAQRLYRRFGFVSCNIKKNYYTENSEDGLDMVYELQD